MSSPAAAASSCSNGVNVENENTTQNVQLSTGCFMKSFPSNGSESSSTLSYRASLFGEQDEIETKGHEREIAIPRFSPRDFPTSWIGKNIGLDSTPFDLPGKLCNEMLGGQLEATAFQPFGSRAQLFHKNKSITGKHGVLPFSHVEGAQLFPFAYHSLKSSSTLNRCAQTFGGSCPEIHADSGTMQSRKSYKSQCSSNVSNGNGGHRYRKSKIVQLLERNEIEDNDETTEMAILQEYFDTMSYTDIVKDRDFRNYLMKKRYLDIMEYIYNSSGTSDNGQLSRAPSTVAPPSIYGSNNDCDSVKKEKLMAESAPSPTAPPQPPLRRYYSSNSNSQVFCRRNSSFEKYYHNKTQNFGTLNDARMLGNHRIVSSSKFEMNRVRPEVAPYATLLKSTKAKPSRCQRAYRQIRAFCEKSLMKYSLNSALNGGAMTLKNCKPACGYSEKQYRRGYKDEMLSEEMSSLVPPGLQGKSDILFGNLHELYTFHNDIFLKDLENCISTTELVALCFVQRRDTFFRLYSYYCQNIPRSERLRETLVDTHLFLQECQKKLGHKLPLAAYLLKPVQRITKYQLLLKDLLKFSDTGTCSRELQKALDCMLVVLKCVNDSMHQIAITGFPADLSQQGELLMQDSFQVWTESKKDLRLRLKTQNRHIFLYQKAMLFCKQGSKTGHNKSTYQFKHWVQMSQIGLTETVRGDSRRFEVWLQGRQEVHTIQASTVEIKNKWVAEIKRVLLNQLEELKGEKIKQYGLNHKSVRHMTSWDVPQAVQGTPNRISSDQQTPAQANGIGIGGMVGLAQDVVTRIAHMNDDSLLSATGISCSSSEHDNQESNAWSSDYSNSEDEFTTVEDSVVPGHKFVSLADYCAMGNSEVSMKEAEVVELLKVGCAGWWFVKVIASGLEGWVPAAYLEPVIRKHSRLRSARSQDRLNNH
uniref:Guanine nucleotide exchange factor DBS n=1 Tax=Anopheles christyi TaxID=43041 RepID=A0A182JT34_9DIPT